MIVSLDFRTSCHELDPGFCLSRFFSSLHRTYDVPKFVDRLPKFVDRLQHRHTYIYTRNMYNLFTLMALPEICSPKFISNLFCFQDSYWFFTICLNLLKICRSRLTQDDGQNLHKFCQSWFLTTSRLAIGFRGRFDGWERKIGKKWRKESFFFLNQWVGILNACVKVIEKVERKKRSSRDWQIDWLRQTWHGNSGPE